MRGKKGQKHPDPADPPRHRANKVRGHGTWGNDRPPVFGLVGRETGQVRLEVVKDSTQSELEPLVLVSTAANSVVNTDEWGAYDHLPEKGRIHAAVCHTPGKRVWARDDDGDGIREVHNNTMEGIWTGLRNFLRPFRGVHKKYLSLYVAIFEWGYNIKVATVKFLRALLGVFTPCAS
jgi:transposase-like protein